MEDSSDTIKNRTRIPCFTVKIFVLTIGIVLDELFTVFWNHAVNFLLIRCITNQFDLTFQHLDENDIGGLILTVKHSLFVLFIQVLCQISHFFAFAFANQRKSLKSER
jgi:hypothetical protein